MIAIDLFAGAGGFTEGATRAGARVVWAANHWKLAVDVHAARHPQTEHQCQDLHQANWARVPDHDVMLASPACQGHSNAGQPARASWGLQWNAHDDARSTAWAVVSAAEVKRPRWIVVENVPRFADWTLFRHWRGALETLGYALEAHVLDAADYGAPQNRRRLFVVGRLGAPPSLGSALEIARVDAWRAMASIVDVHGGAGWAPVAAKSDAVRARVARGRARYGDVFMTQHVKNHPGRSIHAPLPTITCGDQMCVVNGDRMRPLSVGEYLAGQGFSTDYFTGVRLSRREAVALVGNAVAVPVASALVSAISGQDQNHG